MRLTLPWIQQTFSEYNTKYFGGRLPMPRFSLNCHQGNWGYYKPNAIFNQITRRITKINSPGTIMLNGAFSRDEKDWIGTLLHEMIHMYIIVVLKKYPKNQHGQEFYNIAYYMNKDGWDISETNKRKSTDTEINGDEIDTREHNERLIKPYVFCVIEQPQNQQYKLWGFKADYQTLNSYINTTKKLKNQGAIALNIYYCYSARMSNLQSNPQTLDGFGANDYNELIYKVSSAIKEKLTTEHFNLVKTVTL